MSRSGSSGSGAIGIGSSSPRVLVSARRVSLMESISAWMPASLSSACSRSCERRSVLISWSRVPARVLPLVLRLPGPAGQGRVVERRDRVAHDLGQHVRLECGERVDLGLLQATVSGAPAIGPALGLLERSRRQIELAHLVLGQRDCVQLKLEVPKVQSRKACSCGRSRPPSDCRWVEVGERQQHHRAAVVGADLGHQVQQVS